MKRVCGWSREWLARARVLVSCHGRHALRCFRSRRASRRCARRPAPRIGDDVMRAPCCEVAIVLLQVTNAVGVWVCATAPASLPARPAPPVQLSSHCRGTYIQGKGPQPRSNPVPAVAHDARRTAPAAWKWSTWREGHRQSSRSRCVSPSARARSSPGGPPGKSASRRPPRLRGGGGWL